MTNADVLGERDKLAGVVIANAKDVATLQEEVQRLQEEVGLRVYYGDSTTTREKIEMLWRDMKELRALVGERMVRDGPGDDDRTYVKGTLFELVAELRESCARLDGWWKNDPHNPTEVKTMGERTIRP